MLRSLLGGLLACCLTSSLYADPVLVTDKLGKKIDGVKLTSLEGKITELSSFQGKKGIAVVFLSFECPVSNSYAVTLTELHKKYQEKGIQFIGLCPTDEQTDTVRKLVTEYKIPFPVFVDPELTVTDAFKATTTPEAFLLDHNFVLRYRGRIDNAYSARLKKNQNTTEFDLVKALDELVAGKAISTPATKAIGCPVVAKAALDRKITTQITFYKNVLPILQKNCQECHRPGEVGPFSLMTYKQAVNWADDIKEYSKSRQMPPWKPHGGPAYLNDRRMTDQEIETIAKWVDGGTPEGNIQEAPKPREFVEGWKLGKPDLILEVPEDFHVGPSGVDAFRCFVLPTGLTEDKYVIAQEVRPGNPAVVHHTLNFFDLTGGGRDMEKKEKERKKEPNEQDYGPGYSVAMSVGFLPDASKAPPGKPAFGGLSGWAPGQVPRFLPEGSGYFLPAGADIIIQTHYHRNGKPEKDRLKLGLYFAKGNIDKPFRTGTIQGLRPFLNVIPANEPHYVAHGTGWAQSDCTLHSVMPHMHLLGKSVKVTMQQPGQDAITLVDIHEWDYNWQETYWLKEPMAIKKGTKFDIEAVYDNSSKNPNNPTNPPKTVIVGEQTTDEMLFGFIGLTPIKGAGSASIRPIPPATQKPKEKTQDKK